MVTFKFLEQKETVSGISSGSLPSFSVDLFDCDFSHVSVTSLDRCISCYSQQHYMHKVSENTIYEINIHEK